MNEQEVVDDFPVFRDFSHTFAVVPGPLIDNKHISDSAMALYTYIMGKPPTWVPRMGAARERFGWGLSKQQRAVRELVAEGYAKRTIVVDNDGNITGSTYTFYDKPQLPLPELTKPRDRNGHPVPGSLKYKPQVQKMPPPTVVFIPDPLQDP